MTHHAPATSRLCCGRRPGMRAGWVSGIRWGWLISDAPRRTGRRMSEPFMSPAGVYALLSDGRTVQIRPASPEDFAAVKAMHEAMSQDNAYLRFFSLSRTAAEQEARRVTREPGLNHAALLAVYGGQVVGLASYEVERGSGGKTAEVAFAVADTMHQRGIA